MTGNVNELKKKILQKNLMLEHLSGGTDTDEERVTQVKSELDSLLYQYYKWLRHC